MVSVGTTKPLTGVGPRVSGCHFPETPKGFFKLLQADHRHFHRIFAYRLGAAGFNVRRVRKRANRGVWETDLRRGSVPPGKEQEAMRRVICETLSSFGSEYPERDLDVYARGDRVTAAFIFEKGTVGSLSYFKGAEQWCAEPWP